MRDIEIIDDAINTIGALNLPIALIDTIGVQLSRIRRNLMALSSAIKENSETQSNTQTVEDAENVEEIVEDIKD